MTLNAFVLFTLGVLAELIFLLESALPAAFAPAAGRLAALPLPAPGLWERLWTPGRMLVASLAALAALLVGLFELFRIGSLQVYIDTPLISIIMIGLAFLVLAAAAMAGAFLPPVNEQSILLVQGLVLAGALLEGGPVDWLPAWAVTVLPALVGMGLVLWPRRFPAPVKAVLYLWYLLCLMAIPFQGGQVNLFDQPDLTWPEAYASGMLLAFLILHGLFAARFLIITLSMVRPRNRVMVAEAMPRLFFDEQTPLLRALLLAALLSVLLWANHRLGLLDLPIALSLASLLGVQVLAAGKNAPPGK